MRKREVVKIDDEEYTVKELTIQDILDLMDQTNFFGGEHLKDSGVEEQKAKSQKKVQKNKGGKQDDFNMLLGDLETLMKKSCDFNFDKLKKLAPSEIKTIYEGWNRVNADFLSTLKALGFSDILANIKDAVLSSFSNLLATSLKAAM